jgi:hypothetical protein
MNALWQMLLAPALKVLALCASIAGIALGACLILAREPTLGALRGLNRWISTRRALKALEVPRSLEQRTRARRLWLGLALAAGGAYVLIVLIWAFEGRRLAAALAPGATGTVAVEWARWVLVAGSALVVAVGLMMALAPRALEAFEAWSNRWVSSRQALQGADAMHLALDRLVEAFPRSAGVLILALSLAGCAASALLLLR